MKYLSFVLLVAITLACTSKDPQVMKEDQMRRFAFSAYNMLADTAAFQSMDTDQELQQILTSSGVVNYTYCSLDTISFLILDMKESFNLEKTRSLINDISVKHPKMAILAEIVNGKYTLLDRIYKMEQKASYKAEEGQLIPMQKKTYRRFVSTLEIVNDPALAKEYIEVHAIGKAWPEITQNMKTVGIHEMELYLMGYRAFLMFDTKADFDWATDGEEWGTLPREKEWQAHVAKFQKTDPESKTAEKWKNMGLISMFP